MDAATLPANKADEPLSSLSSEELVACAKLLASSVAHHRIKFGIVPITTTDAELDDVKSNSASASLEREASSALQEALTQVRKREAAMRKLEQTSGRDEQQAGYEEKRRQIRISTTAPVHVSELNGEQSRPATLRNISWGSAAICCEDMPVPVGGQVRLFLPQGRDQFIEIEASVLRDSMVDGEHEYGLRFDSLDHDSEARLQQVLKLLMKSPDHDMRRSEGRLVQRLEVEYGDAGEFTATLEDILTGGMLLMVPDPLEIDQSLAISLSSADTPFGLNLRARVVHQTLVDECGIDMYRVGLQFEHPSPGLRERTTALISELSTVQLRDLPPGEDWDALEKGAEADPKP